MIGLEAQERIIEQDLYEHESLPLELRQFMIDLRFHWPASLAKRMIHMGLTLDQIKDSYRQMEEARLNDPNSLRALSLSLDTGDFLQLRTKLDTFVRHSPRRRQPITAGRRKARRRPRNPRAPQPPPLPSMCTAGSGSRLGTCSGATERCRCWQLYLATRGTQPIPSEHSALEANRALALSKGV